MGLFSRKKPEPKVQPQPTLSPEEEMERQLYMQIPRNAYLENSIGTESLDEILKVHAPMHEYRWKQMEERQSLILANQQRIMEELAAIRRSYQTPENAAAPSYSPSR